MIELDVLALLTIGAGFMVAECFIMPRLDRAPNATSTEEGTDND